MIINNDKKYNQFKEKEYSKFIPLRNVILNYKDYNTADIILIDDDPIIRRVFNNNMSKYKIKRDKIDQGRFVE